jgi:hypothetical protein
MTTTGAIKVKLERPGGKPPQIVEVREHSAH